MADVTTYAVKNGSALDKAFKVRGGFHVVAANSEAEVANARPLTEEQIDAFARDGVKVAEKKAKSRDPLDHDGDGKKGGAAAPKAEG